MPVGRRQRVFTFRRGHGNEQKVTLHYGKGSAALAIGEREIGFSAVPGAAAGLDLTLHGIKSRVVAILEGHELYLRMRMAASSCTGSILLAATTRSRSARTGLSRRCPGPWWHWWWRRCGRGWRRVRRSCHMVMKMEQTLRVPFAGVLKVIKCKVGDIVGEGVELAEIEPAGG